MNADGERLLNRIDSLIEYQKETKELLEQAIYALNTGELKYFQENHTVVAADQELQLLIEVDPDTGRGGNPYFKVINSYKPKKGESLCARLDFLDDEMQYHHRDKNGYLVWDVNSKAMKKIKEYLNTPDPVFTNYTIWQMTKWLWNLNYFDGILINSGIKKYMDGEFDNDIEICNHPSYVPSSTPIQNWHYESLKVSDKGLKAKSKLSKEIY